MKKHIIKWFTVVTFLLCLTGCTAGYTSSLKTSSNSDTAETQKEKPTSHPQNITAFTILDSFGVSGDDIIEESRPFFYQNGKYQIKKDHILYCTKENHTDKIPLIAPEKSHTSNVKYMLDEAFLLSDYLFYDYQEYTEKPHGNNGMEYIYGKRLLCRVNLKTQEIDQRYVLENPEQEHIPVIWGADPDSGYIYFSRAGSIYALDLSLNEVDIAAFDSSEDILDIYFTEEGYVLTDTGLYQMNLALDENHRFKTPQKICAQSSSKAKIIGTYGRFLYGYTYFFGTTGAVGHYFQCDLDGKSYKILSADQKKSFFGDYDDEDSFDIEAFADKHELYSEGRDNSDESWDPILIRYILSEDGSIEIETEKVSFDNEILN